ncbi:MAG: hypothetical protein HY926_05325 [Elusimicrobia bacterium]|nr:hypothetical protein [Elusimicrobiota bacterium]
MALIFALLAVVPLLSLVPLHWYATTGARYCLSKAVCLSFSGSVLWGMFSAYVVLIRPDWGWFPYPLLALGAFLCGFCEWLHCEGRRRCFKTGAVLAGFCALFLATQWVIPASAADGLFSRGQAVSSLSRLHSLR